MGLTVTKLNVLEMSQCDATTHVPAAMPSHHYIHVQSIVVNNVMSCGFVFVCFVALKCWSCEGMVACGRVFLIRLTNKAAARLQQGKRVDQVLLTHTRVVSAVSTVYILTRVTLLVTVS